MKSLRDTILAVRPKLERVHVPEWGMDVYVSVMSGTIAVQLGEFSKRFPEAMYAAALVAFTACDATGERIFSEDDVSDLEAQPYPALDRIRAKAVELNGLESDTSEAEGESKPAPLSEVS